MASRIACAYVLLLDILIRYLTDSYGFGVEKIERFNFFYGIESCESIKLLLKSDMFQFVWRKKRCQ